MLTEASQQKLKEIRDSGMFCCMEIQSDYNFVWYIVLKMSEMVRKDGKHEITHKTGAYEDLNEAVDDIHEQVKELIQ